MFSKEIRAYERLAQLQGHVIPVMYGHYHLEFPEREVCRDRIVYVTLLEYVPGPCLWDVSISSMTDEEARILWDKIHKSAKSIHLEGVVHKLPLLRKLIWRKNDERDEIVFTDFSWALILEGKDRESKMEISLEIGILYDYITGAMNGDMYE